MSQWEGIVLDGLDLNDGVDYTVESFSVPPAQKKPEWISGGDTSGAVLGREALYENRTVPLRIRVEPQATMDLAIAKIRTLVDKLQEAEKGGVDLTWTPADSTKTGTLKVLMGEVTSLPIDVESGWLVKAPVVEATLTCKPGIRGTELAGTPASSALPLMTIELTDVAGDLPADGRLVITDNATQSRRHVEWGLESLYYPTSSPPGLVLDSASLVTSGFAGTATTRTGAYSSNGVIRAALAAQDTAICGTGDQTHVGTFRVKARVYAEDEGTSVRLAWQEGDSGFRANPYVSPAGPDIFSEVDLGVINVSPAVLGSQRWTGRIEGRGTGNFDVDYILLIPAGEGYGLARAEYTYRPGVLVAHDEFTAIAATTALNARVSPLGGTWATSGATTDFTAGDAPLATDETMTRAATSDSGNGRLAALGSTSYTDVEVGVRTSRNLGFTARSGLLARHTDASNYLYAYCDRLRLVVVKRVAGTDTEIASVAQVGTTYPNSDWCSLRLVVYASGSGLFTLLDAGGSTLATVAFADSALATGGALATGKPGMIDQWTSAGSHTRYYDDFYAAQPSAEPIAIYSTRSLEVQTERALREGSTGTYYGTTTYRGGYFTVPPAGTNSRKVRIAAKAKRNDVLVSPDDQVADSLTIEANYTPVWLVVPDPPPPPPPPPPPSYRLLM